MGLFSKHTSTKSKKILLEQYLIKQSGVGHTCIWIQFLLEPTNRLHTIYMEVTLCFLYRILAPLNASNSSGEKAHA